MMSAEGLITLERVTLDGTKIKANPGGNTFRRKQKLEAHLELAREQLRVLNTQAEAAERRRSGKLRRDGAWRGNGRTAWKRARSRAPARRKEARSQAVRGACLQYRPGRARDEKRRGRPPCPATTYNCSPTPDTASW